MGALLGFNSAADDRNPLRAEIVGAALHKGIEAISGERESRRILARDIGQAVADAMPECYNEILRLLQERGVRPVHLTVRTVEGPGNQLGGANSGYASLPRDGHVSTRGGAYGEIESTSGPGSDMDLLAAHRRALATAFPGRPETMDSIRDSLPSPRGANVARARVNAAADQQLMTLLRRLTRSRASRASSARRACSGRSAPPRGTWRAAPAPTPPRAPAGGSVSGADNGRSLAQRPGGDSSRGSR